MDNTRRAATKTLCLGAIALSLFASCKVDTNGLATGASANTSDVPTLVPDSGTPLDSGIASGGGALETAAPVDAGAMLDGPAPAGGIPAGGNPGGTGGSTGSTAGNTPATGGRGGMPTAGIGMGGAAGAGQAGSSTAQAGGTAGHAGFTVGGTSSQGGGGSSFGGSSAGGSTGMAGAGGTAGQDAGPSSEPGCNDPTGRNPGSFGPAGVIAYYPGEPTANPNELSDLSRQSGIAMIISDLRPPSASWFGPGKVCGALILSPDFRSHVRLPSGLLIHASEATIASWVYIAHSMAHQRIFDFGENTEVYMFLTSKHLSSGRLSFSITQKGPSSGAEQTVEGPKELPAGEWSHVAVVLGASGAILYVNGVEVAANPGVVLRPKDLGALSNCFLGRSQFPGDPYFDGSIDEFRVYDRALTASEIKQLATLP